MNDVFNGAVFTGPVKTIARYLPHNYTAVETPVGTLVYGYDDRGWTWREYVLPRLASGMYYPISDLFVEPVTDYDDVLVCVQVTDGDDVFGPPAFEHTVPEVNR